MSRILVNLLSLSVLALTPGLTWAQSTATRGVLGYNTTSGCSGGASSCWKPYDTAGTGIPVTASVSASVTGFAPASTGTPISVTTGGVTGTLPAGTVVVASNVGSTNGAYCKLGAAATTSDQLIPPNSWFAYTVGASTQLTCITGTSTTTVNMVGGAGLPTGAGGGGGGGSGGSVTQGTSPWIVAGGGTAGSAATGVATIQGIASMTPVQVSQSGTWTVQPGNTANTTAWKVDGSAVTQPVSGTVTANLGTISTAATAAKQPALGTAGTASTDVLTIQGIASMTPLLVTPTANSAVNVAQINGVTPLMGNGASGTGALRVTVASDSTGTIAATQSGTWNITNVSGTVSLPTGASTAANQTSVIGTKAAGTAATNALLAGLVYNSTPLTLTDGQQASLQGDASGFLKVNVASATGLSQGSTTSGQTGSLVMGAVTTAAPTYTTAQTSPLSLTTLGGVRHDLASIVGTATATAASGVQKVGVVGNAGAIFDGATGAAPPANVLYQGAIVSGATGGLLAGMVGCDSHAKYDASDNGSITLVTGVSGRKVKICGYILATGGTATNLKLREGSDANCATNAADLTPAYQLVANDRIGANSPFWNGLQVSTAAYFVCVNASAGNAHQAEVWYSII